MSDQLPVPAASNTFERIKRIMPSGAEFWSARELARVLEYTDFRDFTAVIVKAREACAKSGHAVPDHFVDINEMVSIGSGAQRPIEDWALSRYACYLVIQNADPAKPLVALGQTYFSAPRRPRKSCVAKMCGTKTTPTGFTTRWTAKSARPSTSWAARCRKTCLWPRA